MTVRESSKGRLAALTGYEAYGHEGRLLGSFGVLPKKSVDRTTWEFEQPGLGRLTGTERSVVTARARRLLTLFDTVGEIAGALVKYHFDFARDGEPVFSIDKPRVFDDWYRLTVHEDDVDRQLVFALSVTMEARQTRPGANGAARENGPGRCETVSREAAHCASWKTRPRVRRRPERTVLTPWRMGAVDQPRLEATGRSRVVKTSPWPWSTVAADPRDCARGRCSVMRDSPPV